MINRQHFVRLFLLFFLSCNKENDNLSAFNLFYVKNNKNDIILRFENNTDTDLVFLTPNIIEFQSLKNNDYQNVYGIIESDKSDAYNQKIFDSLYHKTLVAENKQDLTDEKKHYMSHSVFYLKKHDTIKVLYKLKIHKAAIPSEYKQIYYPYARGIQENYLEKQYITEFSKTNFENAKFILQPVIQDSLFINISEKDIDH